MTKKTDLQPKDNIRATALANGVPRASAWVFSIIAFWSQMKGGMSIGPGLKWQWRNYGEIAAELGYSTKTVGKAVLDLTKRDLIEVRRTWNPTKSGQNVNAFRITAKARAFYKLKKPLGDDPIALLANSEKEVLGTSTLAFSENQNSHDGIINNIVLSHNNSETSTDHSHVSQSESDKLIGEKFGVEFQEGYNWDVATESCVHHFWLGYKWVIKDHFDSHVGTYNHKRSLWIIAYLSLFRQEGFSPNDAVAALCKACLDWTAFSELLASHEGKPAFVTKEYPDLYSLGVYGHVFLDFLLKN